MGSRHAALEDDLLATTGTKCSNQAAISENGLLQNTDSKRFTTYRFCKNKH